MKNILLPWNGKPAIVIDGHFDNPMKAWNWREGDGITLKIGLDENSKQLFEDVPVYSRLPEGWIEGMRTMFDGGRFAWIHENKSRFTETGRQSALLILT